MGDGYSHWFRGAAESSREIFPCPASMEKNRADSNGTTKPLPPRVEYLVMRARETLGHPVSSPQRSGLLLGRLTSIFAPPVILPWKEGGIHACNGVLLIAKGIVFAGQVFDYGFLPSTRADGRFLLLS